MMNQWQTITMAIFFYATLAVLSGCTPLPPLGSVTGEANEEGLQIVSIAESLIGTPYRYGGNSPAEGFDCSGLVRFVCNQIGIKVPRSSRMIYRQARKVSLNRLKSGDLLFFKLNHRGVSHVAIYTANKQFIHSPTQGKAVSTASLNSNYWASRLVGAGRFW
jgi:cell wall-associated NlpC family hydrolase